MSERRWVMMSRWGVVVCFLCFFWLGVDTAVSKAPTVDEYMHVMRGRVVWQTGTLPFQDGHAPLSHWIIGLLMTTDDTFTAVTDLPSWHTQNRFPIALENMWLNSEPPFVERMLFLARLPVLLVGLLTGAVLALWTKLFLRRETAVSRNLAVLVVAILFAFAPNLIANFSLATTDATLVATFVTAVFMMWLHWQAPSWQRWILASIFTGLAVATKMTALVLLLALGLICLYEWYKRKELFDSKAWPKIAGMGAVYLLITAVVLWAAYLFEFGAVAGLPFAVPAPAYIDSFLAVQAHVDGGHNAFLLGELSTDGWWHYFVVATLVKVPAFTLVAGLFSVLLLLWKRRGLATIYFWLPPLLLFLFASYSRLNIGFRHVLPIVPFMWLLIGTAVPLWIKHEKLGDEGQGYGRAKPLRLGLLFVLLAFYVFATVRQHPHHLAYFNEFVGGSVNGAKYLGDSNLGWGQDIRLASDYVKQLGRDDIYLSYYGSADWEYYGFEDHVLHKESDGFGELVPANPQAGLYLVSVSHLQGMGLVDTDLMDWFRHQTPVDQLGFTINVYEVSQQAEGDWIAYCTDPAPLLSPEESERLLGVSDVRRVYFDCHNSWVLPQNGRSGWYILPQNEVDAWPLGRHYPQNLQLVFRNNPGVLGPSYDIYYWDGTVDVLGRFAGQTAVSNQEDIPLPYVVKDTAQLLGYDQEGADWWTVWQASKTPALPITIAGHLYGAASPPTVSDGLGFSGEQWQTGDIIYQRHAFAPEIPQRYLETGLYDYTNGERLADFVQIRPLDDTQ